MGDGIFVVRDGELVVLEQQPYASEDLLQRALAEHPAVLAGGATAADGEHHELFLIDRELGVPTREAGPAVYGLDHLFVASDAVPVIVEVKRSSDTRLRREVVGQMLDYAANGVRYWPVADLQATFERTAGEEGVERLREVIDDPDLDAFWQRVGANLKEGRVRMVFVADALPDDLVRVIEFLNEQMSPAEVLGVELPQYVGPEMQVFVPRTVGRTSAAVAVKRGGTQWDQESLRDHAAERRGAPVVGVIDALLEHGQGHGVRMNWGRGITPGASAWYHLGGVEKAMWAVYVGGDSPGARAYISVYLPELKKHLATEVFDRVVSSLDEVASSRQRMAEARATGFERKYPSIFLADLATSPADLTALLHAFDVAAGVSQ